VAGVIDRSEKQLAIQRYIQQYEAQEERKARGLSSDSDYNLAHSSAENLSQNHNYESRDPLTLEGDSVIITSLLRSDDGLEYHINKDGNVVRHGTGNIPSFPIITK
jgi:hypothetical protein